MLAIHSSPLGPLGTSDTGGMSVYVLELSRWLGHLGHQVDIFTCIRMDAADTLNLFPNVRLVHLKPGNVAAVTKAQLPLQLDAVFEALESYRRNHALVYDLIHSHYWLAGLVGVMAQRRWNCPHVTMFHTLARVKNSTASGENEPKRRIERERRLAEAVDMIVVPATRERGNLIQLYEADARKIAVIPCGVNLDLFKPLDRMSCRRRLGIHPHGSIALYVGRFAPLKGIDALLGAVADLKNAKRSIHLVVAGGDGPDAPGTRELVQQVKMLGIEDRVTFAGRIEQKRLPLYYSACDLLVVPSHYESFGLVVLEALACGRPVVATPVGAVETFIQPGVNGMIVDKPTRAMVARGIARVLDQSHEAPMGADRIRDAVIQHSWQRIATRVIELYTKLIESRRIDLPHRRTADCHLFPN